MRSATTPRLVRSVSVIGLGTWQLGADWGEVSEADARAVLLASADNGVTFFDTADVYGDNASAGSVAPLTPEFSTQIADLYSRYFRDAVHPRW